MKEKEVKIIYGRQPILEALKADIKFDKLIISQDAKGEVITEIKKIAQANNMYVQVVQESTIQNILTKNRISKSVNHQSIIGFTAIIEYQKLEDILPHIYEKGETPLIVILDGVTDVGNFGAIVRSALCMGAHAVVTSFSNSAQINQIAMKASAGALNMIPICKEFSLRRAVEFLKYNGLQILATNVENGVYISNAKFTEPCAIIIGSEDHGVSAELLEKSHHKIHIPMTANFDSLNVSVSAGIILYEAMKQRKGMK